MMRIEKMTSTTPLSSLKRHYMQQATAPLDGMWLCGFVPVAPHFGFYQGDELVGFFCVNDDGYLLQFFLSPRVQDQSSQLFDALFDEAGSPAGKIDGVFVSTAESRCLSLCLDRFPKFEVNALMYQHQSANGTSIQGSHDNALELAKVESEQLAQLVDFAVASLGAPAEWLRGYYANLIDRGELFGVWEGEQLVAAGESRRFDEYQEEYADLGVVVAGSKRGRGIATRVLKQLVRMNESKGLKSICSTEKANVAAQKAIGRAGFFAPHRILQFHAGGPA